MHNPHKLNIDLNRNAENIKIIKIAVENATIYAEKSMRYAHFAEICGKMRQHAKYAVNAYSRETDMPNQQGGLAYR